MSFQEGSLHLKIILRYSCISDEFQNHFVKFYSFSLELLIDIFTDIAKIPFWLSSAGLAGAEVLRARVRQGPVRSSPPVEEGSLPTKSQHRSIQGESHIYVSSPKLSPKFQTHISNCLLDISTQISHKHFTLTHLKKVWFRDSITISFREFFSGNSGHRLFFLIFLNHGKGAAKNGVSPNEAKL